MNSPADVSLQGVRYRVHHRLPDPAPGVTIIIPTRNRLELLQTCVNSLVEKTDYPDFHIMVVDNDSDEANTIAYLQSLQEQGHTVLKHPGEFNFSAINNEAASQAETELVCFMNNDVEVIEPNWLTEMVSHQCRDGVGCVGAKLYYDDDTLQHGGVILGVGGIAGHAHKYFRRDDPGYYDRLVITQSLSAVTAACLLTSKVLFEQVGGFEPRLAVAFNDVDFCLKINAAGRRVIWTPYAEAYHHESKSRGLDDTIEKQIRFIDEVDYLKGRWNAALQQDPHYNPNLSLQYEDFSLASESRVPSAAEVLATL